MKNFEDLSDFIIQRICDCGWKAYLTGGAVRDHFLDKDASDYDLVTDATPDVLKNIFPDRKVSLVGESFLVTLIDGIEVATYRSDKNYADGRQNCVTSVCNTLEEDLQRRDFTFNAMAVCPYLGEVIDPFNGRIDLQTKTIKFVGDADKRIKEDYLRMLRAARFACLFGDQVGFDFNTIAAIQKNKDLVKQIAPERIRMELLKVMKYEKPSIFFEVLHFTQILDIILPELEACYAHTGGKYHDESVFKHCMLTGDYLPANDPILRLSGYLHDIGKPIVYDGDSFIGHEKVGADLVEEICKRFKFSIEESSRMKNLTLYHMRSLKEDMTGKAIRRLIKKFADKDLSWKDWFKLKYADKKANLASENYTKEEIKLISLSIHNSKKLTKSGGFKVTDLQVNGFDIMDLLHIKPGKEIGLILNRLLEMVLDNPEINERQTLIKIVKELK